MVEKLKPCPFCGCKDVELYKWNYWRIRCPNCSVEFSLVDFLPSGHEDREWLNEDNTGAAWNRRENNGTGKIVMRESRKSFIQHKKSRIYKHSQWWKYQQERQERERQEQERTLKKLEAVK